MPSWIERVSRLSKTGQILGDGWGKTLGGVQPKPDAPRGPGPINNVNPFTAVPVPAAKPPAPPRRPSPNPNVGWQNLMFGGRPAAEAIGEPPRRNETPAPNPANQAPAAPRSNGGGGGGQPALARAIRGAQQLNPKAAAPAVPAEPVGTPIAPGASDLLNASAEVKRMFSKSDAPLNGVNATNIYQQQPGETLQALGGGGKLSFDTNGFQQDPGVDVKRAFQQSAGVEGLQGAGAEVANFDQAAMNAGLFDPPTAANSASSDRPTLFNDPRSRAFLDAPDSLEGTRRVRQVLAADIEAAGGDLQKFAADSNQMRPMSIKQLEGYMQGLKDGSIAPKGNAAATQPSSVTYNDFNAVGPNAEAFSNAPQQLPGVGGANTSSNYDYEAMSNAKPQMTAASFDQYLTTTLRGKLAQTDPSQRTAGGPMPAVVGDPDSNRLSAFAAMAEDPQLPPGQVESYSAQNANILHGGGKRGNTAPLPQRSDEELAEAERQRMLSGPSFVTPPAGFEAYHRRLF